MESSCTFHLRHNSLSAAIGSLILAAIRFDYNTRSHHRHYQPFNTDSAPTYTAPPRSPQYTPPASYSASSASPPASPDAAAPPSHPGAWAAHKPSSHTSNY